MKTFALVIVCCIFVGCGSIGKSMDKNGHIMVTLDGCENGVLVVRKINIWRNYQNRMEGISTTAKHGEKVKLIRREGDSVLIETASGKRGWLTDYFIKEFK